MKDGNIWYGEFIAQLEKDGRKDAIELLEKLWGINQHQVEAIVEVKKIHNSLDNYKNIRRDLERAFNYIIAANFQGFEYFKLVKFIDNDENALKIIRYMNDNEYKETEEVYKHLVELVNKYNGNDKDKFERQLKVIKKRLDKAIDDNIGEMLRHARISNRLSLTNVANKTGTISESYISRLEQGVRKSPTIQTLSTLCYAVGLDFVQVAKLVAKKASDELEVTYEFKDILNDNGCIVENRKLTKTLKSILLELLELIIKQDAKKVEKSTKVRKEIFDLAIKFQENIPIHQRALTEKDKANSIELRYMLYCNDIEISGKELTAKRKTAILEIVECLMDTTDTFRMVDKFEKLIKNIEKFYNYPQRKTRTVKKK